MSYIILENNSPYGLTEDVDENEKDGWKPHGSPMVGVHGADFHHYQAMIKEPRKIVHISGCSEEGLALRSDGVLFRIYNGQYDKLPPIPQD